MNQAWHKTFPTQAGMHFSDRYLDHRYSPHPAFATKDWYTSIMVGDPAPNGVAHHHNSPAGGRGSTAEEPGTLKQRPISNGEPHGKSAPSEDRSSKRKKTLGDVAAKFAEYTSLGGVAYMNKSNRWWSTAFWVVVFVAGLGLCTAHLYLIVANYCNYPYSIINEVKHDFLPFPSVTICNRNPIRISGMRFVTPEMKEYLEELTPAEQSDPPEIRSRTKRGATPPQAPQPDNFGMSSMESAAFSEYSDFLNLYGNMSLDIRERAGHQKDVMIIECSFNGYECFASNFSLLHSPEYGNCYTFNSAANSNYPYLSYQHGRTYGLRLELFAEIQEYPSGVTEAKGFSVSIHPFRTMPAPEVTGISVSPGFETSIGIRYTNVSKLGPPYNDCEDEHSYLDTYNYYYTHRTCKMTCYYEKFEEICGCFYAPFELYYGLGNVQNSTRCSSDAEYDCIAEVEISFKNGTYSCPCFPGCTETSYNFQYSVVAWPERSMMNTYENMACRLSPLVCNELEIDDQQTVISENFGVLMIYFEDLAYNDVYEEGTYDEFSLASDVGGTLGLWLGISILTGVEVIQFLIEFLRHVCCKTR